MVREKDLAGGLGQLRGWHGDVRRDGRAGSGLAVVLDGNYDNATDAEKRTAIKELVQVCSVAAGALTVQPVPFLDTAPIAPVQIAMVQGIGKIHGYELNR